nr:hypothetical protein B0A51_05131 [Rachicladosporium sp. CCFEE 5018]
MSVIWQRIHLSASYKRYLVSKQRLHFAPSYFEQHTLKLLYCFRQLSTMLPYATPLAFRPSRPVTETQWQQHEASKVVETYPMSALPTRGGRPQKELASAPLIPQPIVNAESLFVTEDAFMTTSSGRMLNSDGSRPGTFCHTATHLRKQPHHHKLRCGHEVVTAQIKACGENCEVVIGSSRPTGLKFSCPNAFCKKKAAREASATPFIPSKTAEPKMTWRCISSSVKGTDAVAASARDDEVRVARLPVPTLCRSEESAAGHSQV